MSAILFGSIGTIVETSELQRRAFNEAFADHDLNWHWDQGVYRHMLATSGGVQRITAYAQMQGIEVNSKAIHLSKSIRFQRHLREADLLPRAGVTEVIGNAKENGFKLAFVTTTLRANIEALFQSVQRHIREDEFDTVIDLSHVSRAKPARDAYEFALNQLDEESGTSLAIEDNVDGVTAAKASGLHCFAFPGSNTANHDYGHANEVVNALEFDKLLYQLCDTAV
ncbi:MAG: HAD-IA family hydrolase [Pseudomonadota bacterium]